MKVEEIAEAVYEDPAGFPTEYGPERVDDRPGHPFLPHELYRDMVIIFIMTGLMFILSATLTPPLGPSGDPASTPDIVPDWYLLWSWGILKIVGEIPVVEFAGIFMNPAFWGTVLSGVPVIILFLVPFLDKGRATRPAKAPVRSAWGILGIIFIFAASMYSVNHLILERWPTVNDFQLKLFFFIPPALGFFATYVGLRRLGFKPMRTTNTAVLGASMALFAVAMVYVLLLGPLLGGESLATLVAEAGTLAGILMAVTLILLFLLTFIPFYAATFLATSLNEETRGQNFFLFTSLGTFFALLAVWWFFSLEDPHALDPTARLLVGQMHFLLGLPAFSFAAGYLGMRTPYSQYEYLLNECYQCGKCHLVCPVVDVENKNIGGLNLVYITFKKEHDGVPLWTCLACDACSAICPLDIDYSAYILEERAKATRVPVASDGGEPEGLAGGAS